MFERCIGFCSTMQHVIAGAATAEPLAANSLLAGGHILPARRTVSGGWGWMGKGRLAPHRTPKDIDDAYNLAIYVAVRSADVNLKLLELVQDSPDWGPRYSCRGLFSFLFARRLS